LNVSSYFAQRDCRREPANPATDDDDPHAVPFFLEA